MQFARFFVDEEGHRRAPIALARNDPVGAAFDHGFQARTTPRREEFGVVHGFDGFVAQGFAVASGFVHADKPLACRAVNQRGFVAPAVGVAVFDFAACQEVAGFFQPLQDDGIRFPNAHAGNARRFAAVFAFGVDGVVKLDAVFVADGVVFQTVRGGGVHQARTGVGGNMFAVEHENIAFEERMIHVQVFQLVAGGFSEDVEVV